MSNPVRIALATAAVIVVAFVGLRFLPIQTNGPGTPTTAPSIEPSAAPTVAPTLPPNLPPGSVIEPGTYLVTSYTQTRFAVTVPAGWVVDGGMLHKGDFYGGQTAVLLRPWIVSHVYADACRWQGSMQPVGPTKAALVAALAAQTGRNAAGPVEVTLGGLEATKFVFSVPSGFDTATCNDGYLRPFPGADGNEDLAPPMFATSITELYIVETGLKATAIQAAHYEATSAEDLAELESMLDSIVFMP